MFNRPFSGCCNQLPPAPPTCQKVCNVVETCNVQDQPHIINYHTHQNNSFIRRHVTVPQFTFSEGGQVFDEFAGPSGPFAGAQPMQFGGTPMPFTGTQPMPFAGAPMPFSGAQPMQFGGQPMPFAGAAMPTGGAPIPFAGASMPFTGGASSMQFGGSPVPFAGASMPFEGAPVPFAGASMPFATGTQPEQLMWGQPQHSPHTHLQHNVEPLCQTQKHFR